MPEVRKHNRPAVVRFTEDEHAMLHAVAEHMGVTASDVLRICIRNEYRERFGEKRPKPRTSSKR